MKTLQSTIAKTRFSSILRDVEVGDEFAITRGKTKRAVAVIVPYEKWKKTQKRKLGTLEGKMSVTFTDDFAMTDEELASL